MLTNFSKWMIYTASYILLYPLLIVRLLFTDNCTGKSLMDDLKLNFWAYKGIIFILVGFFLVSCIVLILMSRSKPNTRCTSKLEKNITYEVAAFILPYIISVCTINLDWYGWAINFVIYVVLGLVVVCSDILHLCPAFLLLGYKLYKDSNGNFVYSRLSKEKCNLINMDEENGISAKILTPNLMILKRKSF